MITKIDRDHGRFQEIVRGRIKRDLKKYITHGELIGKKGHDLVSIPLPEIEIPRFRFGENQGEAVAQGDGEPGDEIGQAAQEGPGSGEAGEGEGRHILEVELTIEELAKLLGEELELPRVEPRGVRLMPSLKDRYTSIRHVGPESLRHFKRTYLRALKRTVAAGEYDPGRPIIVPERSDKMYRSWRTRYEPESNAIALYLMDVSGSMGEEQKAIVRTEAFWIDAWLRSQYRRLEVRYGVHDVVAREVDEEAFYHTRESGGTMISSAYRLAADLLRRRYPASDWNVYIFQFSDGDNLASDNERCFEVLEEELLPAVNQFAYGQVKSLYGSGEFKRHLDERFESAERLVTTEINDREEIYDSIRAFLGKGR